MQRTYYSCNRLTKHIASVVQHPAYHQSFQPFSLHVLSASVLQTLLVTLYQSITLPPLTIYNRNRTLTQGGVCLFCNKINTRLTGSLQHFYYNTLAFFTNFIPILTAEASSVDEQSLSHSNFHALQATKYIFHIFLLEIK